jgi:hypothetical protein
MTRTIGLLSFSLLLAGLLLPAGVSERALHAQRAPAVSQRVLLERLGAYVDAFGREFEGVVAREQYTQVIRPWPGAPPPEPAVGVAGALARRDLVADLLLVFDAEGPWHLHRDVQVVDGVPVGNRETRLAALFLEPSLTRRDRLRRMTIESARYNLGDVTRTLNIPTFPLIVAHRSNRDRFRFRTSAPSEEAGRVLRAVTFVERQRPTLVRSTDGRNVPLRGRLWVEEATGALVHASLDPEPVGVTSRVQVWFDRVPGLALRVPVRMWEWYQVDGPIRDGALNRGLGFTHAYIEALAEYDDFRRYGVETHEEIVR